MANVRNFGATLLSNATATGQPVTVPGGRYVWAAQASAWGGATASLQALGPDGATYMTITTLTADGTAEVLIGEATTMKVAISGGPPTAVYSNLRGVE